ncbi:MAG: ergothioneine biosynthesis protein EgtB [Acidobacteria bacterium]|nr:ergothioneine biosynthesis protein EgtB [Acidobacteriota bacterium]
MGSPPRKSMDERQILIERFLATRAATERLAEPLSPEDQLLQSMPDCSPTKWHRAHTTWFFETFVLLPAGVAPFDPSFAFLFNSYYENVGPRHARPKRGVLSRPASSEIAAYRSAVDGLVVERLERASDDALRTIQPVVELGIAHEEQHQELMLTDILNAFSENPTLPAYRKSGASAKPRGSAPPLRFIEFPGGAIEIGAAANNGFVFDNELPRHRVWLEPFALADRLLTVGEWKEFADAGGYERPVLWLSDGFEFVRSNGIRAPLYARRDGDALVVFGLDGEREAADDEPLAHVSFYEADAIATFFGARLPTEEEWETATGAREAGGENFRESGALRPLAAEGTAAGPRQLFGDVWEWTRSSYSPYPGFRVSDGALGEYNGKFMVNQFVLRGGSCFTPRGHIRASYRNFWYPSTRFQMTGVRLARSTHEGGAR